MSVKGSMATPNFEKAMALLSLGVPMLNVSGQPVRPGDCWEFRFISTSDLEKHGCGTIEDAEEKGVEGSIVYGFGPHPEQQHISKAFDEASKAAWANSSAEIPDTIEVVDAGGKKRQMRSSALIAMGIAFAFRNAEKFWPRRTQVVPVLKLEKGGNAFAIIDRKSDQRTVDEFSK